MTIGDRLRALREERKLSQGDIEKRTGLGRPYISRVENNHSVPSIETMEKWARALEVPMYRIFYDGDEPPIRGTTIAVRGYGCASKRNICSQTRTMALK
jgi:transcriptional regulator with XRE-family HTH domain